LKSGFIDLIGKARKNRGEKFRGQLYIFVICLLISIFIWSLVRLSRDYFYTTNYQIRYTQLPSSLRVISFSDSVLTLSIKLQGFDFFSEDFLHSRNSLYSVSLRKIKTRVVNGELTGYLPTYEIGRELAGRLNFPSEIYMLSPDTLFFSLEKTTVKRSQTGIPGQTVSSPAKSDSLDSPKVN
jgi:hypothetical protein